MSHETITAATQTAAGERLGAVHLDAEAIRAAARGDRDRIAAYVRAPHRGIPMARAVLEERGDALRVTRAARAKAWGDLHAGFLAASQAADEFGADVVPVDDPEFVAQAAMIVRAVLSLGLTAEAGTGDSARP